MVGLCLAEVGSMFSGTLLGHGFKSCLRVNYLSSDCFVSLPLEITLAIVPTNVNRYLPFNWWNTGVILILMEPFGTPH